MIRVHAGRLVEEEGGRAGEATAAGGLLVGRLPGWLSWRSADGAREARRVVPGEPFFNATMSCASAMLVGLALPAMGGLGLYLEPGQVFPKMGLMLLLWAGACFYRWRGDARLHGVFLLTFWAVVLGTAHLMPMFVATRLSAIPADGYLAAIDRAMGLEVPTVLGQVERCPGLRACWVLVYNSLLPLMMLAMVLPPMVGRMWSGKRYAVGSVAAALMSMPMLWVFQATGPWVYYGYTPLTDQTAYMNELAVLRSGQEALLDLEYRAGLICFPSFHTILAVLSAVALWPVRGLRWFAAGWAGLIVVSTVTTGTHYIVDVVGGLAVAQVAGGLGWVYSGMEEGWNGGVGWKGRDQEEGLGGEEVRRK